MAADGFDHNRAHRLDGDELAVPLSYSAFGIVDTASAVITW